MRKGLRDKKHPYAAYILLVLMLSLIFGLSSQQGRSSHNLSINICKKVVMFLDNNAKLGLEEKQYLNFVKYLDIFMRKAAHIVEYAMLGAILYVVVSPSIHGIGKQIIFVIVFLMLAGCVDEFHQLYVLARDGKWQDVVVDMIGGSIGLMVTVWGTLLKGQSK